MPPETSAEHIKALAVEVTAIARNHGHVSPQTAHRILNNITDALVIDAAAPSSSVAMLELKPWMERVVSRIFGKAEYRVVLIGNDQRRNMTEAHADA